MTRMQFSKYVRYLFCCLLVISTNSCRKDTPVDLVPEQQDLTLKPPGDLQIISMTETEVVISWTDNNSSETSFDVEQSTDSTYFSVMKSVSANVTTATIPGTYLTTNIYYFRVKAKSSTTTSGPSNVVQRTLTLSPPGDLQIISMTETEVVLNWTDNNSSEQSYDVEQSTDSTYFSVVKSASANVTTATIPGTYLTTNIYYFRVKAKSSTTTSGPSNVVQRTLTLSPPGDLQIISMTETEVVLNWTDNNSSEQSY